MSAIGALGALIVVFAWLIKTIDFLKKKKRIIDLNFALFYMIGLALLAYYAYEINEPVFLALKIMLLIIVAVEIIFTIYSLSKGWKWK